MQSKGTSKRHYAQPCPCCGELVMVTIDTTTEVKLVRVDDAVESSVENVIAAAKAAEPTKRGGYGPRYTLAQLKKGLRARAQGRTCAEVAAAAGVKSPNYFAKVLRGLDG